MKQIITKIMSVFMAIVVLVSTMSFTVDMHFCGDQLVDTGIFSPAESCGMDMKNSASDSCSVSKKDCCSDEHFIVDGQDELRFNTFDYSIIDHQLFVATFITSYINLFEGLEKEFIPFKEYSPPNLVSDIRIIHQVFRI